MKKRKIIILMLFIVFFLSCQAMAQEKPKESPMVVIENTVYTFEPVPEGIHVASEFIIKNKGNAILHIENVLPP